MGAYKTAKKMTTECKKCGIELDEGTPQQNGMRIDCFADDWGELVELSPMVSPRALLSKQKEKGSGGRAIKMVKEEIPPPPIYI